MLGRVRLGALDVAGPQQEHQHGRGDRERAALEAPAAGAISSRAALPEPQRDQRAGPGVLGLRAATSSGRAGPRRSISASASSNRPAIASQGSSRVSSTSRP